MHTPLSPTKLDNRSVVELAFASRPELKGRIERALCNSRDVHASDAPADLLRL